MNHLLGFLMLLVVSLSLVTVGMYYWKLYKTEEIKPYQKRQGMMAIFKDYTLYAWMLGVALLLGVADWYLEWNYFYPSGGSSSNVYDKLFPLSPLSSFSE